MTPGKSLVQTELLTTADRPGLGAEPCLEFDDPAIQAIARLVPALKMSVAEAAGINRCQLEDVEDIEEIGTNRQLGAFSQKCPPGARKKRTPYRILRLIEILLKKFRFVLDLQQEGGGVSKGRLVIGYLRGSGCETVERRGEAISLGAQSRRPRL